jgi:hypothetical protein
MLVTIVSLLCIGFLIGFNIRNVVSFYENKKKIDTLNKKFLNILNELESGRSKFRTRFSNSVYINISLEEYGKVDIVYMIDKNDIAIFKGIDCILTTHSVNRKIIDNIIYKIKRIHDNDINDVVNIFGLIMNRKEFENISKMKIDDFNKMRYSPMNTTYDISDVDKIVKSNESKFNIDDILDKISSIGIESLSNDERKFLEDYSKNR